MLSKEMAVSSTSPANCLVHHADGPVNAQEAAYTNMIGSTEVYSSLFFPCYILFTLEAQRTGKHDIALMWMDLSAQIKQSQSGLPNDPDTHVEGVVQAQAEPQEPLLPVNEVKRRDPGDNKMRVRRTSTAAIPHSYS